MFPLQVETVKLSWSITPRNIKKNSFFAFVFLNVFFLFYKFFICVFYKFLVLNVILCKQLQI